MSGHQDLAAVEGREVDTVFDVSEHGLAHREVRRRLEVEQARQHAAVSTGIEQEICLHAVLATVFAAHAELRFSRGNVDTDDGFAIADLHALQRGLIGQQLIEIGALDLKRRRFAVAERLAEIEGAVALAPGKRGTGFQLEAGGVDGVEHARFFDEIQAMGQQAFTNGKTWKMLTLDHQHIVSLALEQRGGDGTRRTGTDDHDLAAFHFNGWHGGSLPGQRLSGGFGACRSGLAAV
ncbi:hypothetical protein D3C84_575920 [compost metagenome]